MVPMMNKMYILSLIITNLHRIQNKKKNACLKLLKSSLHTNLHVTGNVLAHPVFNNRKHYVYSRDGTFNNLDNTCNRMQNPKIKKENTLIYQISFIFTIQTEQKCALKSHLKSCRRSLALNIIIRDVVAGGMIIIGVREIRLWG
jgi:hypothetical protein